MTQAELIRMGLVIGLGKKETLLSAPGEIFDLLELYIQQNGLRKQQID